jgi:hypothetical protein
MQIIESGITLDLPDNNVFRFERCQGYKDIQQNFKEMDVCWYDSTNDTLYMIELKEWKNDNIEEEKNTSYSAEEINKMKEGITKHRIHEVFKKSLDSVSMFISILLKKPFSQHIQRCSPFTISENTTIKLLTIVDWHKEDTTYISTISDKYKSYFKPYAKLFGIKSYVVMTKSQAIELYNWIK